MNYLAHAFLSFQNEEILFGNFIADYLRNKEVANYPINVQKGIQLHRQIDTFTDSHPVVLQAARSLYESQQKYAPIVIDVFFDYLLVKNWATYSEEPLSLFTQKVYHLITERQADIPLKMKPFVTDMIANDYLRSYGTIAGIQSTFERIHQRTRFKSNLLNAVAELEKEMPFYNEKFIAFFPEILTMAKSFLERSEIL